MGSLEGEKGRDKYNYIIILNIKLKKNKLILSYINNEELKLKI